MFRVYDGSVIDKIFDNVFVVTLGCSPKWRLHAWQKILSGHRIEVGVDNFNFSQN